MKSTVCTKSILEGGYLGLINLKEKIILRLICLAISYCILQLALSSCGLTIQKSSAVTRVCEITLFAATVQWCAALTVCSCVANSSSLNQNPTVLELFFVCSTSWIQFEMLPCCAGFTGGQNIENSEGKGNRKVLHW